MAHSRPSYLRFVELVCVLCVRPGSQPQQNDLVHSVQCAVAIRFVVSLLFLTH